MVYGDTERISREAPVLILQHTHTKHILGGASNASHNVSKINNGKVSVIGVVGDDYQANDLIKAFEEANIDCSSLIKDKTRKTNKICFNTGRKRKRDNLIKIRHK